MARTQAPRDRSYVGWLIAAAAIALLAVLWIVWTRSGEGALGGRLVTPRPVIPANPVNPPLPERPHLPASPLPGPR